MSENPYLPNGSNVVYQQTAVAPQPNVQNTSAPRGINQLINDPTFVNSAAPIRNEMFNQWVDNDLQQILATIPPEQRNAVATRAKQIYAERVQQPEPTGFMRSVGDTAVTFGNAALGATGAIAGAVSPENRFTQFTHNATDWSAKNLLSQQTQEAQLARQQRRERADGVMSAMGNEVANFKDAPINYTAELLGGAAPVIGAAAGAAAAAPAAGVSAALAGSLGGLAAGGAASVGDVRQARVEQARNLPFSQLMKSPEVQGMINKGMSEAEIRDALANQVGWQEGVAFAANAIPGSSLGRIVGNRASGALIGNIASGSAKKALTGRIGSAVENAALGAVGGGVEGGAIGTVKGEYDPNVNWVTNAVSGATSGALAGGLLGGALSHGAQADGDAGKQSGNVSGAEKATPDHVDNATAMVDSLERRYQTPDNNSGLSDAQSVDVGRDKVNWSDVNPKLPDETPDAYADRALVGIRTAREIAEDRYAVNKDAPMAANVTTDLRLQEQQLAKNVLYNITNDAFSNGHDTAKDVASYVADRVSKLSPEAQGVLETSGVLPEVRRAITESTNDSSVTDYIKQLATRELDARSNEASGNWGYQPDGAVTAPGNLTAANDGGQGIVNPTGVRFTAPDNGEYNSADRPVSEATIPSGDGSNDTTPNEYTNERGQSINPERSDTVAEGSSSAPEATPVFSEGRYTGDTTGATNAPPVSGGAIPGPSNAPVPNAIPVGQGQPANAPTVGPAAQQGGGRSADTRAAGVEPVRRSPAPSREGVVVSSQSINTAKEKNAQAAMRTTNGWRQGELDFGKHVSTASEIATRLERAPKETKAVLDAAAKENGSLSTPIFVQEALASKVSADKTLWGRLSDRVKRAVSAITRGLAVALAAVSFYHMRPIEARAGDVYANRHVIEGVVNPDVISANSWVRDAGINGNEKYMIIDTGNHDLYVMKPDGTLMGKVPVMADGTIPQSPQRTVSAIDGSGNVDVSVLTIGGDNGKPTKSMSGGFTLLGDAIAIPNKLAGDLVTNFSGKVIEVNSSDNLTVDTDRAISSDAIVDRIIGGQQDVSSPTGDSAPGVPVEAGLLAALLPRRRSKDNANGGKGTGEEGSSEPSSPDTSSSQQNTTAKAEATYSDTVSEPDLKRAEAVKNSPQWDKLSARQKAAADMTPPTQTEFSAELGKGVDGALSSTAQIKNFYYRVKDKFAPVDKSPETVMDLLNLASTGELDPYRPSPDARTATSKIRETITDQMEPVYAAFGNDPELKRNLAVGRNLYNLHGNQVRDIISDINTDIAKVGRKHGMAPQRSWEMLNTFLRAYVAEDMNNAARKKHFDRYNELRKEMPALEKAYDNAVPGSATKYERAMIEMQETLVWLEEFDKYNNIVRAQLKNEEGMDARFVGGLTTAEGKAILNATAMRKVSGDFKEIADRLLNLIPEALEHAIKKGVISQAEVDSYIGNGKYVPTTGRVDADTSRPDAIAWGGKIERSRDGRMSLSDSPIQTILAKVSNLYYRADMAEFYDQILKHGKDHGFKITKATGETAPIGTIMVTRAEPNEGGGDKTVKYVIQNDDHPEVMAALTGKNIRYQTNAVLNRASQWTAGFSWAVTRAVPMFAPANGFRDIGERVTNIISQRPNGIKVAPGRLTVAAYKNYFPAVRTAFKYLAAKEQGKPFTGSDVTELHKLFEAGGVLTRNTVLINSVRGHVDSMRPLNKFMGGVNKTMKMLSLWNEAFETAASLAVYKALKAQGIDDHNAASVTLQAMDLNQRGTIAPFMNVLYPFFSTRMVGADNIFKNLSSKRGLSVMAAQVVAGVVLYDLAKAMAGNDVDEAGNNPIDQLTDQQVARTIPLYTGSGFARVPVPYGVPYLAWNLATAISRYNSGRDTIRESTEHVLQAFLDETIPAGSPPQASPSQDPFFYGVRTVTPEILRHIVNIASNKNDFGDPLNTQYMDATVPRWQQGKASTQQFWKDAAQYISPLHDMTPEEVREMAGFVIPPISGIVSDIEREAQNDGTPAMAGAAQLLGINRVYTTSKNPLNNIYFPALNRAQQLERNLVEKYGAIPTAEETGIRNADARRQLWLSRIPLDAHDEAIMRALFENQSLRAKTGTGKLDEDDIKRIFLRKVGNAT